MALPSYAEYERSCGRGKNELKITIEYKNVQEGVSEP